MQSIVEPARDTVIRLADYLLPEGYDPSVPLEWEQTGEPTARNRSGRLRYCLETPSLPRNPDSMRPCLFWLMAAHRRYCDGRSLGSGRSAFRALKSFVTFLAPQEPKVCDITDITATLLHRYRTHLRSQSRLSDVTSRYLWAIPVQLLRILSQHRGGIIADMLILHQGLGTISAGHPNMRFTERVLSREELGTIIATCRSAITSYRLTWHETRAAISTAHHAGYSGDLDPHWDDYGQVLLWLEKIYRSGRCGEMHIKNLISRHICGQASTGPRAPRFSCASKDDIYLRIIPDASVLLAYFLHICVYLAANGATLLENLRTDCIEEDVAQGDPQLREVIASLGETRESVVWIKGRSKLVQRRTFEKNRPWSPPTLIREWIAMTESLRQRAPERWRQYVFLADDRRRAVHPFTEGNFAYALANWRASGVSLPQFSLTDLRKAALNQDICWRTAISVW